MHVYLQINVSFYVHVQKPNELSAYIAFYIILVGAFE